MSEEISAATLEEYKTLRQEILEMDKRKNNLVVYTVVATATIFGLAVEYPSSFIFLLPIIIIVSFGYQVLGLQRSILHNATYIAVVIEKKTPELNWETYVKNTRILESKNKKRLRQLSNYLLFDLLGFLCVTISVTYTLIIDQNFSSIVSEIMSDLNQTLEILFKYSQSTILLTVLVLLWFVVVYFLINWTKQMRECYGAESQSYLEQRILKGNNSLGNIKSPESS